MDIDVSKVREGDIIPTEGGWLVNVLSVDNSGDGMPLLCNIIDGPKKWNALWCCVDGRVNIEGADPSYKEYRLLHQWRYYPPEQRPQVGWKLLRQDGEVVEVSEDDGDDYAPFLIDRVWYKYECGKLICCIGDPKYDIINNIRYIGE